MCLLWPWGCIMATNNAVKVGRRKTHFCLLFSWYYGSGWVRNFPNDSPLSQISSYFLPYFWPDHCIFFQWLYPSPNTAAEYSSRIHTVNMRPGNGPFLEETRRFFENGVRSPPKIQMGQKRGHRGTSSAKRGQMGPNREIRGNPGLNGAIYLDKLLDLSGGQTGPQGPSGAIRGHKEDGPLRERGRSLFKVLPGIRYWISRMYIGTKNLSIGTLCRKF